MGFIKIGLLILFAVTFSYAQRDLSEPYNAFKELLHANPSWTRFWIVLVFLVKPNIWAYFGYIYSITQSRFRYYTIYDSRTGMGKLISQPGENEFPKTVEEMDKLLGVLPRNRYSYSIEAKKSKDLEEIELPEEFDARTHWPKCNIIKAIANQGQCGSCWAVAAATAFSDRLCIASKGKFNKSLSYHQLTTCCHRCGYGCDGGFPEDAWDYFHRHGLVTGGGYSSHEGCQPYEAPYKTKCMAGNCTNPDYPVPFKKDLHKTTKPVILDDDENEIMKEIYKNGPVEASFDVFSDFVYYRKGVYQRTKNSMYRGGHAIRIIGWGVEDEKNYWLCANSWGTGWGDKGTFKILRGTNECFIEDRIVVSDPIV